MRHFEHIPQFGVAFTLWPLGILWRGAKGDRCSVLHEEIHWQQQRSWRLPGLWVAAWLVVALLWRKTGPRHPMESTAYRLERECRHAKEAL